MKKKLWMLIALILVCGGGYLFLRYYSYIMAKDIDGVVTGVERVETGAIIAPGDSSQARKQIFSFAVAIKSKSGEIFTASSEDRRWAVVTKGSCVVTRFYPYPFWNLEKSGTFFSARLIRLYDCPSAPTDIK